MQAEEFRSLLNEIYAEIIYIDFSLDGLYIGKTEEDLPVEDLHEKLAETLKVDTVTGIHIDDEEPTNVWVTYENTEDRTNFQMLKDVEALYPKEIGIISDAEIRFYNEALNVDKRDVSDLRNLRDFVVMYYSQKMVNHNDESAYISKDFVSINDKMSAICTVIDQKLYRLDAKL